MRCSAAWTALLSMGFALAAAGIASARDFLYHHTEHFTVICVDQDITDGKITTEQVLRLAADLETTYARYVDDFGLRRPGGKRLESHGKSRTIVMVYDWLEMGRKTHDLNELKYTAAYSDAEGRLHFRVDRMGKPSLPFKTVLSDADKLHMVAHELFHLIQLAYIGKNQCLEDWLAEATAQWAVREAFPNLETEKDLDALAAYIEHPWLPIDSHDAATSNQVATGHPYGTFPLFRFLAARNGGLEFLRRVMNECAASAKITCPPDLLAETLSARGLPEMFVDKLRKKKGNLETIEVVQRALGDPSQWRLQYDRYAIATALGPLGEGDRLAEAKILPIGARREAADWESHLRRGASGPENAAYRHDHDNTVGVGGFRVYELPLPPPGAAPLDLWIEAGSRENFLSLQCVFRPRAGAPLEVRPATYSKELGRYLVRIPNVQKLAAVDPNPNRRPSMFAVVTCYVRDLEEDAVLGDCLSYPLYVTAAAPPVLERIRIAQGGQPKYEVEWTVDGPNRVRRVRHERGLDSAQGNAQVELHFSKPVGEPTGQPLLSLKGNKLDLTPAQQGAVWSGTIPAGQLAEAPLRLNIRAVHSVPQSELKLPLDIVPTTVAEPVVGSWANYEQSPNGMELSLGLEPAEAIVVALESRPFLEEGDHLLVKSPAFADIRAGKTKTTYSGAVYASTTPNGPFTRRVGGFDVALTRTKILQPGEKGTGWFGPETIQVQVMPGLYMERVDPITRQAKGFDEGPVYYEVALQESALGRGPTSARPVRSNVVGPDQPEIRLLYGEKDGLIHFHARVGPHTFGELTFKLAPKNQDYGFSGARFKVTYGAQSRFGVATRQAPRNASEWGKARATIIVPQQQEGVQVIMVEAQQEGRTFSQRFEVAEDKTGWTKLTAEREAAKKRIQADTDVYQRNADRSLATAEKLLQTNRQALEKLKSNPGGNPSALQTAEKRVADAIQFLEKSKIDAKKPEIDRLLRLESNLDDYAAAIAGRKMQLEYLRAEFDLDPKKNEVPRQKQLASNQIDQFHEMAQAALNSGDLSAFREALVQGEIPLREEVFAKGWPPQGKVGVDGVAGRYEFLADGLVTLTGETAEAKSLYLKGKLFRETNSDAETAKALKARWAAGNRPSWWPGD